MTFFRSGSPQEAVIYYFNMEMVSINAGTFQMGSPTTEPGRNPANGRETEHSVTLTSGFKMGKYPVTQAQYMAVMVTNPSRFKTSVTPEETSTENRPVENVSWYDAIVFCNKLSMKEGLSPAYRISGSTNPDAWGTIPASSNAIWDAVEIVANSKGYRLPTEAQWEYACRAGTTTAFNWGTNTINATQANYDVSVVGKFILAGNSRNSTTVVGSYTPNAWGLYDMHGNVAEWCWDWFANGLTANPETDPTGTDFASGSRVYRGGSWDSIYGSSSLRSAYRIYGDPYYKNYNIGFRVVRP